jgi:hypothetical protein
MRKYVVYVSYYNDDNPSTMFMIEKGSDEAAIRFVLDVDTPTATAEEFEALVMERMDMTPNIGPFYMIFSVGGNKVIFGD